ncbi:MAG: glutathionylspermidine synthase family protein [Gemmatimonadaceae bacterium]
MTASLPISRPWLPATRLGLAAFADVRRRAIFECCKWDPQVEDECSVADFALLLSAPAWRELTVLAERLAVETLAAERELAEKPWLHERLGLPRAVRRSLRGWEGDRGYDARGDVRDGSAPRGGMARLIRFDFHLTPGGWMISEANTDVPGGLNEASGFSRLMAPHYAGATPVGDPAGAYADAIAEALVRQSGGARGGAMVALAHATAYTDDRQVMTYLAAALESRGVRAHLVSPAHLRWRDGRARLECAWADGAPDAIVRFFPGEWLPNLPRACSWTHFFCGSETPLSNPATALLTQSKRFPLVWDELSTPLPTWRALLPETRDPRDCDWQNGGRNGDAWVVKPALGRVGEDVGIPGVTDAKEWRKLVRAVKRRPGEWVAQRRFHALPLDVEGSEAYPCVGVYTVDGRAAGAYGRLGRRALINWKARDVAILQIPDRAAQPRSLLQFPHPVLPGGHPHVPHPGLQPC